MRHIKHMPSTRHINNAKYRTVDRKGLRWCPTHMGKHKSRRISNIGRQPANPQTRLTAVENPTPRPTGRASAAPPHKNTRFEKNGRNNNTLDHLSSDGQAFKRREACRTGGVGHCGMGVTTVPHTRNSTCDSNTIQKMLPVATAPSMYASYVCPKIVAGSWQSHLLLIYWGSFLFHQFFDHFWRRGCIWNHFCDFCSNWQISISKANPKRKSAVSHNNQKSRRKGIFLDIVADVVMATKIASGQALHGVVAGYLFTESCTGINIFSVPPTGTFLTSALFVSFTPTNTTKVTPHAHFSRKLR